MNKLIAKADALATAIDNLLQGEPLRVIVYSAAIVAWVISHVAEFVGWHAVPEVTLDQTLGAATFIAAGLTEACRKFVYSPAAFLEAVAEAVAEVEKAQPIPPKP